MTVAFVEPTIHENGSIKRERKRMAALRIAEQAIHDEAVQLAGMMPRATRQLHIAEEALGEAIAQIQGEEE